MNLERDGISLFATIFTANHYPLIRPLFCTLSHFCSQPLLAIRQLDRTCVLYATWRYLITSQNLASLCRLNYALRGLQWDGPPKQPHTHSGGALQDIPGVVSRTPGLWPYYAMRMGCFLCVCFFFFWFHALRWIHLSFTRGIFPRHAYAAR